MPPTVADALFASHVAEAWYRSLPVITRGYLTVAFATTVVSQLELVSPMLLYLDSGWDPAWGGQLRIFEGMEGGQAEAQVDVVPEGGTLGLMRSDLVTHEVLRTERARTCLVGWFRTLGVCRW